MSTTTATNPNPSTTEFSTAEHITTEHAAAPASRTRVWRMGVVAGVAASVATTLTAVAARAGDIDLAVGGEEIPLLGFAQLTMVGALVGIALAKACSRWASRPRRTFVTTTAVLTALSIVPDVVIDATTGSKVVLAATHVVAAAIIVPALTARLPR